MVGGLLMKSSQLILRPELFSLSPSPAPEKSLYLPSARVCFRRNNNYTSNYTSTTSLSSSGVNHIFSAPRHKLDNFIFGNRIFITSSPPHCVSDSCCSSSFENEISPFIVNNHHSVITVPNKIDEIKNKVFKLLASLLLFGFLAFITTPTLQGSASYAAASCRTASFASTSLSTPNTPASSTSSTPSSSTTITTTKFEFVLASPIFEIGEAIVSITLFLFTIPLTLALISGFKYFLQLCKSDKKSVLMLQVGVLDKKKDLQRVLAQIADSSNSDCFKFKEVVNEVLQRYDSCRFAYLSATKCLSDEEKKYRDIFAEMMRSICVDPPALVKAYFVFTFYVKSLAIFIHGGLKKAIRKIKYGDKCSKQLFGDVLTRELVRYDRHEETLTFAYVDGVKREKEAVGIAHSMVDNGYTVVTILVLASGIYSIPPVVGSTEHVKNVLQKFNTIPKSEIETLEVLQTPHSEDQGLSAQEVQKNFPLLKPLY